MNGFAGLGYWGSGATCPAGAYASLLCHSLAAFAVIRTPDYTDKVTGVQIKKMKETAGWCNALHVERYRHVEGASVSFGR